MCGIVGFVDKRPEQKRSLGKTLLGMLQALSHRGPDSAGVAIFGHRAEWHIRVSVASDLEPDGVAAALRQVGVTPSRHYGNGVFDALIRSAIDLTSLEERIRRRLPGAEIICLGQRLNLFKQVGSPAQLEQTYHISNLHGTHGIGHTRLSTESRVDLSHSQPFWAHGVPDLATVHNGQITNYHKLRRRYEQRGYHFYTANDSELIGVYLRDRLAARMPLVDALRSSLDVFDGSYSYLAATGECFAYVRDRFGFKPLIVAETEQFVALATEEIALRQALGRDFVAREPAPGTVALWNTSGATHT